MKQLLNRGCIVFALSLILSSCGSNNSNDANKRLGKMEVQIPAELENNKEVVEYITGMSQVADEYAILIDDMLEEVGEYAGMEEEELGMMDKIRLTKATAEVALRSTEIMAKWAEYQNKRNNLEEQLSDAELQALESVWKRFEERIQQIEARHSEVFNQEEKDTQS